MSEPFTPPYPTPHRTKSSLLARFMRGWESWIHVLFDKSYTMKMGEIRTPGLHMYIANELSLVERIMGDAREFPKHQDMIDVLDPLIGNSVFSANGEDWEQQREMINPSFQHTALTKTLPLMCAAADDLISRIAGQGSDAPTNVDPLMTHVAADIIFRTLFSVTLDAARADVIHRAFVRYQRHAQSGSMLRLYRLPTLGFKGRAARYARDIHSVFEPIVRARYTSYHDHGAVEHHDILQSLFEARHPRTGSPFTCAEIMEQVSTIFLAGHETSASLMTWALYLLAECHDIQRRVREEVADHAGDEPLTTSALRQMSVLRNVVRETLRLYPPVAFLPREVTQPTKMRDKHLQPGSMLVVSPWLIQRNRDNWTCPHAFDPDRFELPENQDMVRQAYLPFGKGPRICVGAGFAQQEAMVVLATIIRRFTLESPAAQKPEPVSRLTLRPKMGVLLHFQTVQRGC